MARSFLAVTAGSGTKLGTNNYTDGADSKHDELMVLGEQFLPSYMIGALSAAISTATLSSHLLQIMAGASNIVRVRRIDIYQLALATAAVLMDIGIVRLTTAGTGGTVIGAVNLNNADGAAGATSMTLPTVKGTEGNPIFRGTAYMMQTVGASAQLNQPILSIDFDRPRSEPLIIPAGTANGICIKCNTAVAAGSVYINVLISESPY